MLSMLLKCLLCTHQWPVVVACIPSKWFQLKPLRNQSSLAFPGYLHKSKVAFVITESYFERKSLKASALDESVST